MGVFEPKLWTVLREGIPKDQLIRDLFAGLIVGVVALPLAIAFAIASGVTPAQGLATAIIAGLLISVFSGSRVQIGGPTGAFIIIVYEIIQLHGYAGLAIATIMAGVILILLGLARFGSVLRFIPHPVTVGFTAGIAVVIANGQVRDALGLRMTSVPSHMIEAIGAYGASLSTWNPAAAGITVVTVLILLFVPKFMPKIPGPLAALVLTTVAVQVFGIPLETVGSRFGSVPSGVPMPSLPDLQWSMIPTLISPAVSIALLAGIESLLSAVVADGMTGRRHRSNTELIAQGIANIASPLFGGIPATGAIARTATNIKSGGRTPIAGIVHALTLLVILMLAGDWAALIPMATLAGILLVVAYHMSELPAVRDVLRSTRSDGLVLLATFFLTVLADLTIAIQVGVVLAAILFMKRMADVAQVRSLTGEATDNAPDMSLSDADRAVLQDLPQGIAVFAVSGPFFFGAAQKFKHSMSDIQRRPSVLILVMRDVLSLDASGLRVLDEMLTDTARGGPALVLCGVHTQPLVLLERSGFLDRIGSAHLHGSLTDAVTFASTLPQRNGITTR